MSYLKIGEDLYPATIRLVPIDGSWNNRTSAQITVAMAYEQAMGIFQNGLEWSRMDYSKPLADADGNVPEPEEIVTDFSELHVAGPVTNNRDGTITAKMGRMTDGEILAELLEVLNNEA